MEALRGIVGSDSLARSALVKWNVSCYQKIKDCVEMGQRVFGATEMIIRGILFLALLLITNCQTQIPETATVQVSDDTKQLVQSIHNDDIQWDGTYVGLIPRGYSFKLVTTEEKIDPFLIEALLDEDRFVAAHVILTMRTSIDADSSYEVSAEGWNGLRVGLTVNETVSYSYDGNDLEALHQHWIDELADK